MGSEGWGIVFVLGIVAAITVVIVVIAWQILGIGKASTIAEKELARDGAYRALAEEATAAQQALAEEQRKIARDVADLRERMVSVERMLKEVG